MEIVFPSAKAAHVNAHGIELGFGEESPQPTSCLDCIRPMKIMSHSCMRPDFVPKTLLFL